jgi:hypothetical protein
MTSDGATALCPVRSVGLDFTFVRLQHWLWHHGRMPDRGSAVQRTDRQIWVPTCRPIIFGVHLRRMMSRLRSLWRRLSGGAVETVPRWWLHCPICDRELVGPWNAGVQASMPTRVPVFTPPTRQELIAKCPAHGALPYNDATRNPSVRREASDESRAPSDTSDQNQATD